MPPNQASSGNQKVQTKAFSWVDLAKHTENDDLYVAVRGKVYNITEFANRHPGGKDILLAAAGRDATQVFETYHPLSTNKALDKFQVGELTDIEPTCPTFPEPNQFFVTVKQRVEDYFKETGKDPKNPPWMYLRYFMVYFVFWASWSLATFVFKDNVLLQIFLSFTLGWAAALIGLLPMHDSSHFSVTHKPWVWRLLGHTHDFFNGASFLTWTYQHSFGHHPYTNIDKCDPDVDTAEYDFRRIKRTQPWHALYIPQHIYVPIMYVFLAIKTRIQDITILRTRLDGSVRVNAPTGAHWFCFIGGKLFFLFYRIGIPLYFGMEPTRLLLLCAVSDGMTSYWLALTFQANHVVEEVEWPLPDKNNHMKMDWAEHQVVTTVDYAHDSWFWNVFSGGLNHQTTHHLFPWVNQWYYPEVSPILIRTAKEFGVKHRYKKTYSEAIGSHLNYLKSLGALAPERFKKRN